MGKLANLSKFNEMQMEFGTPLAFAMGCQRQIPKIRSAANGFAAFVFGAPYISSCGL